MTRPTVQVCIAEATDLERLIPLWIALRTQSGQTLQWAQRAARDGRMQAALARADVRILLATCDGQDAGYAVATISPLSGLAEEQAVWIDQMWVSPQHRGAGVAKALLVQVCERAEELGCAQVVCFVPVAERSANRYFAKLGFAGVLTVRATSTASLRRTLVGHADPTGAATIRQRRSLRARSQDKMKVAGTL